MKSVAIINPKAAKLNFRSENFKNISYPLLRWH